MKKNDTPAETCSICGKAYDPSRWIEEIASVMREKHICFNCAFWEENIRKDLDRDFAVINGKHYVLGPHTDKWPSGMGGARFKIRFADGRETVCDNLWCQGKIPEHFRNRLPDNAEFIKEEGSSWCD